MDPEKKKPFDSLVAPIIHHINDPAESLDSAISTEFIQNNEILAQMKDDIQPGYPGISFVNKVYDSKNLIQCLAVFR